MYTFTEFLTAFNSKNKATSNMKLQQVLKKLGLDIKIGIFVRDDLFSTNFGTINLQPSGETHCVCYIVKH